MLFFSAEDVYITEVKPINGGDDTEVFYYVANPDGSPVERDHLDAAVTQNADALTNAVGAKTTVSLHCSDITCWSWPLKPLISSFFKITIKKTPKPRITVDGNSPSQRASSAKNVCMSCRHHEVWFTW